MVRHEAAEAVGAIGSADAHALLASHAADPAPEVAQTCELALARVAFYGKTGGKGGDGDGGVDGESVPRYLSVDPAPPAPASTPTPVLAATLADEAAPLWDRYRALFALRDRGGPDAVAALAAALRAGRPKADSDDASNLPPVSRAALLKHEVAYVLGQMQDPASVPALVACLADGGEHAMVRHEAAEALGAVGGGVARSALLAGAAEADPIVAQSCEVALDVLAHEESGAFEYCDV
jgi:deoxyhypusine monooxygenase